MIGEEKKSDIAEALDGVDGAIGCGFSELAGRIAKFERATVTEMMGEIVGALYRIADGLSEDSESSLTNSVGQAGKDIRAGLESLAAAIRERKTVDAGTF